MFSHPRKRECSLHTIAPPFQNETASLGFVLSFTGENEAQGSGLHFLGAANEARTRYLHLGKVALYRMS